MDMVHILHSQKKTLTKNGISVKQIYKGKMKEEAKYSEYALTKQCVCQDEVDN